MACCTTTSRALAFTGSSKRSVARSPPARVFCSASSRPAGALRPQIAIRQIQGALEGRDLAKKLLSVAAGAAVLLGGVGGDAQAAAEKIAEFNTSGLVFKDSVQIVELEDKAVGGVTIYLTDYKRSITERLGRDPFSDPSLASVTCVPTGTVTIKDAAAARKQEEIFAELKTLNLLKSKALRVRRIYDEKNGVLLYVAYSTRFNSANDADEVGFSSRYRTSVCAVPVAREAPALVDAAPSAAAE